MTARSKNKKRKMEERKKRPIDRRVKNTYSWFSTSLIAVSRKKIRMWTAVFIIAFILGATSFLLFSIYARIQTESQAAEKSFIMEKIKNRGCVTDGLLSGYGGDTDNLIEMVNRSECQYLHRAVETWIAPPDFDEVSENMAKLARRDIVVGMFLAEAIDPREKYFDPAKGKEYKFSKFCKEGSLGTWGENTCKASMDNTEYRQYLKSIIQRAIDLGITSFLFGQVYMQEGPNLNDSRISDVMDDSRKYAKKRNLPIVFGAQTNTIYDEDYLRKFDYIEGGIGESPNGNLDQGPCSEYYSQMKGGWCWALLWHKKYASKANDVVLHLDWNGSSDDDMSVFSKMSRENRISNLQKFYKFFTSQNMGFLMPFLAVINPQNPTCYGPSREFYAPDNKYSCQDEDAINAIMAGSIERDDAKFVSEKVPTLMTAGKKFQVSIELKNTGKSSWTKSDIFQLGSPNDTIGMVWGINRIDFGAEDNIAPGDSKVFLFEVTAPQKSGTYDMEWQMIKNNADWFGEKTEIVSVLVTKQ